MNMESLFANLERVANSRRVNMKDAFKNWHALRPDVRSHLQLVYVTLAATVMAAAMGAWADLWFGIGGLMTYLATVGGVWWLTTSATNPRTLTQRSWLLLCVGFCKGASLGSLVGPALYYAPGLVVTAFLGTSVVFACFSGAAMMAERRSMLYLGAVLSSLMGVFFMLRFSSLFFAGATALFGAELYLGLAAFIGYVLVDTQLIVERAHAGDKDHIRHAMDLFIDFAAIFARLLLLLLQGAQQSEAKRREQDRRRDLHRFAHRK